MPAPKLDLGNSLTFAKSMHDSTMKVATQFLLFHQQTTSSDISIAVHRLGQPIIIRTPADCSGRRPSTSSSQVESKRSLRTGFEFIEQGTTHSLEEIDPDVRVISGLTATLSDIAVYHSRRTTFTRQIEVGNREAQHPFLVSPPVDVSSTAHMTVPLPACISLVYLVCLSPHLAHLQTMQVVEPILAHYGELTVLVVEFSGALRDSLGLSGQGMPMHRRRG